MATAASKIYLLQKLGMDDTQLGENIVTDFVLSKGHSEWEMNETQKAAIIFSNYKPFCKFAKKYLRSKANTKPCGHPAYKI